MPSLFDLVKAGDILANTDREISLFDECNIDNREINTNDHNQHDRNISSKSISKSPIHDTSNTELTIQNTAPTFTSLDMLSTFTHTATANVESESNNYNKLKKFSSKSTSTSIREHDIKHSNSFDKSMEMDIVSLPSIQELNASISPPILGGSNDSPLHSMTTHQHHYHDYSKHFYTHGYSNPNNIIVHDQPAPHQSPACNSERIHSTFLQPSHPLDSWSRKMVTPTSSNVSLPVSAPNKTNPFIYSVSQQQQQQHHHHRHAQQFSTPPTSPLIMKYPISQVVPNAVHASNISDSRSLPSSTTSSTSSTSCSVSSSSSSISTSLDSPLITSSNLSNTPAALKSTPHPPTTTTITTTHHHYNPHHSSNTHHSPLSYSGTTHQKGVDENNNSNGGMLSPVSPVQYSSTFHHANQNGKDINNTIRHSNRIPSLTSHYPSQSSISHSFSPLSLSEEEYINSLLMNSPHVQILGKYIIIYTSSPPPSSSSSSIITSPYPESSQFNSFNAMPSSLCPTVITTTASSSSSSPSFSSPLFTSLSKKEKLDQEKIKSSQSKPNRLKVKHRNTQDKNTMNDTIIDRENKNENGKEITKNESRKNDSEFHSISPITQKDSNEVVDTSTPDIILSTSIMAGEENKNKEEQSRHEKYHQEQKEKDEQEDNSRINDSDKMKNEDTDLALLSKKTSLTKMPKNRDQDGNWLCQTCGASFTNMGGYRAHLLLHSSSRPFKCPHCPQSFLR